MAASRRYFALIIGLVVSSFSFGQTIPGVIASSITANLYPVDTVLYLSFENENLGTFTTAEFTAFLNDSNNVSFKDMNHDDGTTDIVDIDWNGTTERVLSIYQEYAFYGVEVIIEHGDTLTEGKIRMRMMQSAGYSNVLDGKHPGASAYKGTTPVGATAPNWLTDAMYWTVRPGIYGGANILSTYHYDDSDSPPNPFGDNIPYGFTQDSVFTTFGAPYVITQNVHCNTWAGGVSPDDGFIEVFTDGKLTHQVTGMTFQDYEDDGYLFTGFALKSFHNFATGDDTPLRDSYLYIKDILVYTDASEDAYWGTTHPADELLEYPGFGEIVEFYVDSIIDIESENLTSPNHPGDVPFHTNYRWLIDAGASNTVQIDFGSGDETDGGHPQLLIYDGETTSANLLFSIIGADDLDTYDFGSGTPGRFVGTTQKVFIMYSTDENGGGDFDANITFN